MNQISRPIAAATSSSVKAKVHGASGEAKGKSFTFILPYREREGNLCLKLIYNCCIWKIGIGKGANVQTAQGVSRKYPSPVVLLAENALLCLPKA